ncbi:hypothetical protein QAD02_018393 [Eretmocerus hayati]|uniref:Uncharacterized protein n=1 Tax=Eretmocerus hayati TaxID=131215 RepID=A0ACC2PIF3_9HYME|nr:hypothetical protein QAD02_018393 [Eretmocerus hayati]
MTDDNSVDDAMEETVNVEENTIDADEPVDLEKTIQEFYDQIDKNKRLFKLLAAENNFDGRIILYVYAKTQDISQFRVELSRMIIKAEFLKKDWRNPPLKIEPPRCVELSEELVDFFHTEKKPTLYYDPYYSTVNDKGVVHKKNASGPIVNAIDYVKTILTVANLSKLLPHKKEPTKNNVAAPVTVNLSILQVEPKELTPQLISKIIRVWLESFSYRRDTVFATIEGWEIISTYPVYKNEEIAVQLNELDFSRMFDTKFPGDIVCSARLKTQWPTTSRQLIKSTENKIAIPKRKGGRRSLQSQNEEDELADLVTYETLIELMNNNKDIANDNHRDGTALLLLTYIIKLNYKSKLSVAGDPWRPVQKDITQAFIVRAKGDVDLPKIVEKLEKFHLDHYSASQPYIVFCGELRALTCCHVVYHSLIYKFTQPIDAADFIFKLLYVLKLDFPPACPQVYSFLQSYTFQMEKLRTIASAPQVKALAVDISNITLQ